jgi:hypothetical protein
LPTTAPTLTLRVPRGSSIAAALSMPSDIISLFLRAAHHSQEVLTGPLPRTLFPGRQPAQSRRRRPRSCPRREALSWRAPTNRTTPTPPVRVTALPDPAIGFPFSGQFLESAEGTGELVHGVLYWCPNHGLVGRSPWPGPGHLGQIRRRPLGTRRVSHGTQTPDLPPPWLGFSGNWHLWRWWCSRPRRRPSVSGMR